MISLSTHSRADHLPALAAIITVIGAGLFAKPTKAAEESESPPESKVSTLLLDPVDNSRGRTVPLKVYLPSGKEPKPVILFSHGLGGSREGNPYLGNHWASEGYVAIFLQHPGSDRSVWEDASPRERLTALKSAANLQATKHRFEDVPFVIDQLEAWSAEADHPLQGRMKLDRIGLAGHSYGAVTTLGLTDRTFGGRRTLHEKRIDAFLPMSPQPGKVGSPERFFGSVSVPVLCMTGTEDGSPIDPSLTPGDRRKVYAAFPPGDKYQLVLDGAHHFAFGGSGNAAKQRARNPDHHPTIQAISTKFWDAYLKDDPAARAWLQSEAPREACSLAKGDVWEWK